MERQGRGFNPRLEHLFFVESTRKRCFFCFLTNHEKEGEANPLLSLYPSRSHLPRRSRRRRSSGSSHHTEIHNTQSPGLDFRSSTARRANMSPRPYHRKHNRCRKWCNDLAAPAPWLPQRNRAHLAHAAVVACHPSPRLHPLEAPAQWRHQRHQRALAACLRA